MVAVCFCNRKGGVGKTLSTYYTGRWLARAGQRVTMVDLDPQRGLWDIAALCGAPDGRLGAKLRLVDAVPRRTTGWVLIDTPPALDGSMPALREADYLIIPVIPEAQELAQLKRFLIQLEQTRTSRPFTRTLGVLPVRFVARWRGNREMLDHVRVLAAEFSVSVFPPVPFSAAVGEYSLRGGLWRPVADALLALEPAAVPRRRRVAVAA